MSQIKTVITRSESCNYLYNVVSMEFSKHGQMIHHIIKHNVTLEKAQSFFGVNPSESFIDSEGDKIA